MDHSRPERLSPASVRGALLTSGRASSQSQLWEEGPLFKLVVPGPPSPSQQTPPSLVCSLADRLRTLTGVSPPSPRLRATGTLALP
eukprot:2256919-Rhodomonas_salina.1